MIHFSANMDDFGLDSRSLAGSLQSKLKAAREAGFSQILLAATELVSHPDGVDAATALVRNSGLRVTGLQALSDFEGLPEPLHTYKIDIAQSLLVLCHALGCHLLLVNSSTLAHATGDANTLCRHLRQLAILAIPMNIRIGYRATASGKVVNNYGHAWDLVCQADMPNLGLCLDVADALAWHGPNDDLDMLDCDKLFLVQLADTMGNAHLNQRVFPGEGEQSSALAAALTTLHELGYRGDYSLAVWHDDNQQSSPQHIAQRALRAAQWLGQDVLQRSVPLPNQIRLKRAQA